MGKIKRYFLLAIIFGVLAFGIFLFPGAPDTLLGWILKLLMLIAFGVYLWVLLQELQVNMIAVTEREAGKFVSEKDSPGKPAPQGQIELSFEATGGGLVDQEDATTAYHTFLKRLLSILHETFVSHSVVIYIVNAKSNQLILQEGITSPEDSLLQKVPIGSGVLSEALNGNVPVTINEFNTSDNNILEYYGEDSPDIKSFLSAPILYNEKPIGIIAIDDKAKQSYSKADELLLEQYALLISAAMTQLDVLDQLAEQRNFYSRLCQVNSQLTLSDSLEDLFSQIVQVSRNLFQYDCLTVVLLQEQNSNQAEIAAIDGNSKAYESGYRFEIMDSMLNQVIETGCPHLVSDLPGQSTGDRKILPELHRDSGTMGSILMVPVRSHTETYGAIILENTEPEKFSMQDQEILSIVGSVFGAGLNRFYLYRYMKNIATRDGLTGIFNYRAFRERLDDEIQRSERYQMSFSLCIADLDKFKRINDTHGHLYGDYVLKEIAGLIKNSVRSIDVVARYGGEEFAIILVNASINDAYKTANRIRESIKNFHFEKDEVKERITISLGMAEFPTHGKEGDVLISHADEAMYQVKQTGGNAVKRYSIATPIEEA